MKIKIKAGKNFVFKNVVHGSQNTNLVISASASLNEEGFDQIEGQKVKLYLKAVDFPPYFFV